MLESNFNGNFHELGNSNLRKTNVHLRHRLEHRITRIKRILTPQTDGKVENLAGRICESIHIIAVDTASDHTRNVSTHLYPKDRSSTTCVFMSLVLRTIAQCSSIFSGKDYMAYLCQFPFIPSQSYSFGIENW